jgi:adenosylcobinamide-GDP ribazoletransferase
MRIASALRAELRAAGAAVALLTCLPLPARPGFDGDDVGRAAPFFPLVGTALGAGVAGAATLLAGPCPELVAAGLALALGVVITGAIHFDGLADTADALAAGSRERALAIMRDSCVGVYGVTALVLLVVVEAGALAALGARGEVLSAAAAFGLARAVAPALACVSPYARAYARESGLGASLAARGRARAAVGVLVAAAVAVIFAGERATLALAAAGVCWAGAFVICRRRFGGVTGDTLGATIVLTEAACLTVAASA